MVHFARPLSLSSAFASLESEVAVVAVNSTLEFGVEVVVVGAIVVVVVVVVVVVFMSFVVVTVVVVAMGVGAVVGRGAATTLVVICGRAVVVVVVVVLVLVIVDDDTGTGGMDISGGTLRGAVPADVVEVDGGVVVVLTEKPPVVDVDDDVVAAPLDVPVFAKASRAQTHSLIALQRVVSPCAHVNDVLQSVPMGLAVTAHDWQSTVVHGVVGGQPDGHADETSATNSDTICSTRISQVIADGHAQAKF